MENQNNQIPIIIDSKTRISLFNAFTAALVVVGMSGTAYRVFAAVDSNTRELESIKVSTAREIEAIKVARDKRIEKTDATNMTIVVAMGEFRERLVRIETKLDNKKQRN